MIDELIIFPCWQQEKNPHTQCSTTLQDRETETQFHFIQEDKNSQSFSAKHPWFVQIPITLQHNSLMLRSWN